MWAPAVSSPQEMRKLNCAAKRRVKGAAPVHQSNEISVAIVGASRCSRAVAQKGIEKESCPTRKAVTHSIS
jgi:hypothetical protein